MLARHHHPNVYTEKVSPRGVQHVVSRKPNPERDVSGVPSWSGPVPRPIGGS